jgi:hypothetical protein
MLIAAKGQEDPLMGLLAGGSERRSWFVSEENKDLTRVLFDVPPERSKSPR